MYALNHQKGNLLLVTGAISPSSLFAAQQHHIVYIHCRLCSVCRACDQDPVKQPVRQLQVGQVQFHLRPRIRRKKMQGCHYESFNPFPSKICCIYFSILAARVLDCLG